LVKRRAPAPVGRQASFIARNASIRPRMESSVTGRLMA
jgi:hypothetical protein